MSLAPVWLLLLIPELLLPTPELLDLLEEPEVPLEPMPEVELPMFELPVEPMEA